MIENTDTIKWLIGVPSAVVATITLPLVIKKIYLETKKLEYELATLKSQHLQAASTAPALPRKFFTWFAHYWPIPCYGALGLFSLLGLLVKSATIVFIGAFISLMLFVAGSAVNEKYLTIIKKNESSKENKG